jgi:tetratricopeptide (TPR) repeat protein
MLDRIARSLGGHPRSSLRLYRLATAARALTRSRMRVWLAPLVGLGVVCLAWVVVTSVTDHPHLPKPLWAMVTLAAFLLFLSMMRARQRTVIQAFAVHDDGVTAVGVNGEAVAHLLAAELSSIRDLYRSVSEQRVETAAATGGEPIESLDVTAAIDDVASYLADVVPADSRLDVGPISLPIGVALTVFARVFRGPRMTGSIHSLSSRLTIIVNFSGPAGQKTWRSTRDISDGASPVSEAISELATQMMSDLTFGGAIHWRALLHLNRGLAAYHRSTLSGRRHPQHMREVRDHLSRALAEDQDFGWIYYNLGLAYEQENAGGDDPTRANLTSHAAVRAYERAVVANPGRWEPYFALARRWQLEGARDQATITLCKRIAVLTKRPRARGQARLLQAQVLGRLAGLDNALGVFETDPHFPIEEMDDLTSRSLHEAHVRSLEGAGYAWISLFGRAWLKRTNPRTRATRGRALVADCLAMAASTIGTQRRQDANHRRTRQSRDLRRCKHYYEVAAKISPDDGNVTLPAGMTFASVGEWSVAEYFLDRARAAQPAREKTWAMLAWVRAQRISHAQTQPGGGETAHEIRECCRAATASAYKRRRRLIDPEQPLRPSTFNAARSAYLSLHAIHENQQDLADANELDRMRALTEKLTAERDSNTGQNDATIADLEARYQDLRNLEHRWEAAQVAIALSQQLGPQQPGSPIGQHAAERAEKYLIEAISLLADDHDKEIRRRLLLPALARIQRRLGALVRSQATAQSALDLDPTSFEAWHQFALASLKLGDTDRAINAWEAAQRWNPPEADRPDVHYQLGVSHWRLSQNVTDRHQRRRHYGDAIREIENALLLADPASLPRVDSDRGQYCHLLGNVHLVIGNYAEASKALTAAIQIAGKSERPIASYYAARALVRQGDHRRAEDLLHRLVGETSDGDVLEILEYRPRSHRRGELRARAHLAIAWSLNERQATVESALSEVDTAEALVAELEARLGNNAAICRSLRARCAEHRASALIRRASEIDEAMALFAVAADYGDDLETSLRWAKALLTRAERMDAGSADDCNQARRLLEHVCRTDGNDLYSEEATRLIMKMSPG